MDNAWFTRCSKPAVIYFGWNVAQLLTSCFLRHRLSNDEEMRVTVWRRPKNASNIQIPTTGHLASTFLVSCLVLYLIVSPQIPQEAPQAFGW